MQERLIFLIGAPRSGTTLLAARVGAHSAVHQRAEPHSSRRSRTWATTRRSRRRPLRPAERRAGDPRAGRRPAAGAGGLPGRAARLRRRALRRLLATAPGKRFFLDKTPAYALVLPFLTRLYPKAHYVVLTPPPARRPLLLGRVVLRRRLPGCARPQPAPRPLRARRLARMHRAPVPFVHVKLRGAGCAKAGDPLPPASAITSASRSRRSDLLRREGRRARWPRRPDRRGAATPAGHVVGSAGGRRRSRRARDARAGEQLVTRLDPADLETLGYPRAGIVAQLEAARGAVRTPQARGADALRARAKAAGGPAADIHHNRLGRVG